MPSDGTSGFLAGTFRTSIFQLEHIFIQLELSIFSSNFSTFNSSAETNLPLAGTLFFFQLELSIFWLELSDFSIFRLELSNIFQT